MGTLWLLHAVASLPQHFLNSVFPSNSAPTAVVNSATSGMYLKLPCPLYQKYRMDTLPRGKNLLGVSLIPALHELTEFGGERHARAQTRNDLKTRHAGSDGRWRSSLGRGEALSIKIVSRIVADSLRFNKITKSTKRPVIQMAWCERVCAEAAATSIMRC